MKEFEIILYSPVDTDEDHLVAELNVEGRFVCDFFMSEAGQMMARFPNATEREELVLREIPASDLIRAIAVAEERLGKK